MSNVTGLDIPTGLSRKGRKAAAVIKKVLAQHGMTHTGGCRAFYTPKEWSERGEQYGTKSLLVVVYDGGDLYNFLSYNSEWDGCKEVLRKALEDAGVYAEACTGWYSAIYES